MLFKDKLRRQAGNLYDDVSGASAAESANDIQQAAGNQAGDAIGEAYQQGQGLLAPYQQGAAQNWGSLQQGVSSGAYSPQYQGYQGPVSNPTQQPQYQGYQGPMSAGNQNIPQYQAYNAQARPNMGLGKTNEVSGFGLLGQNYSMPPEFQRQAATSENVNMYQDPGYQFRLQEGLNAVQNSAAAKGLLGSSAALRGINDYAQGMASQEFGNAYNRFQTGQNNGMADYQDQRNFNSNALDSAYGRFSDSRNSTNANFNSDRGFGAEQTGLLNNWNANNADRSQANFNNDRSFGYGATQDQNSWNANQWNAGNAAFESSRNFLGDQTAQRNSYNMQSGQNRYNMQNGLVQTGYGAAGAGAQMASNYGQSMAGIYTGMGNANAESSLAQSKARRGLFGDAIELGTRFLPKGK